MEPPQNSAAGLSQSTINEVKRITKECRQHCQDQLTTELVRVITESEAWRQSTLESLLTKTPLKFPSHERAGIVEQIRAEFFCHIRRLGYEHNQAEGSLLVASTIKLEFDEKRPPPFTIPQVLSNTAPYNLQGRKSSKSSPQLETTPEAQDEAFIPRKRTRASLPPLETTPEVEDTVTVQRSTPRKAIPKTPESEAKSRGNIIATPTRSKPITNSTINRIHRTAFVFAHRLAKDKRFVLFCPGCKKPFTKDPFQNTVAFRHFQKCSVQNEGEDDIFLKHAHLEQRTKAWVTQHNRAIRKAKQQALNTGLEVTKAIRSRRASREVDQTFPKGEEAELAN
ncbi:hypothetical protein CSAL01_05570 [Colletotrichum salicis]|uniref:Uncharacterized protein n=1 Tax=Colletotrichum salicis TaxID=1209931 RepID=A0A135V5X4_9PEZI|nr:hypothetical protein CSAL01_05570 [Colletotrichum salicis]